MNDNVILVNEQDEQTGLMPKLEAHEKGLLHRAFSVFLFNTKGEFILQQRAADKYHSAGLWSNTCCSHPLAEEDTLQAAHRRLNEEMGLQAELKPLYSFIYKASLERGLTEYEFDHIFTGISDQEPVINREEVADWKYIAPAELLADIENRPEQYSVWFKLSVRTVIEKIKAMASQQKP